MRRIVKLSRIVIILLVLSSSPSFSSGTSIAPGKNGKAGQSLEISHGQSCRAKNSNKNRNSDGVEKGNGEAADCDSQLNYKVGDFGPGGGVIFYYRENGFSCGPDISDLCHYLEMAPAGWSGSSSDPHLAWSASAYTTTNVAAIPDELGETPDNSLVGRGYFNSLQIVSQSGACTNLGDCDFAAGAALAYVSYSGGKSYGDWFLPNAAELNQLCKFVKGLEWISDSTVCAGSGTPTNGINPNLSYWSSSEGNQDYQGWVQYMGSGSQFGGAYKGEILTQWVRPVRSF